MSDDVLVRVENVSKRFCRSLKRSLWYGLQDLGSELDGRRHGGGSGLPQSSADVQLRQDEFWAVKDVSFELRRGECLGLIGRNGAGKTTLLRMLNGLIKPDTGKIEMNGRIGALIALGAGFNPVLTGRENIYTAASVMGLSQLEAQAKLDEIVDFAEIGDFIDSPVQTYSSGMQVRLGFAVASSYESDILILDEVLAVGDNSFRAKCINRITRLLKTSAVIFVSHTESQVKRICSQALLLSKGQLMLLANDINKVFLCYNNQDRDPAKAISDNRKWSCLDADVIHCKISPGIDKGKIIKSTEPIEIKIFARRKKHIGSCRATLFANLLDGTLVSAYQAIVECNNSMTSQSNEFELLWKTRSLYLAPGTYQFGFSLVHNSDHAIIFRCEHLFTATVDLNSISSAQFIVEAQACIR